MKKIFIGFAVVALLVGVSFTSVKAATVDELNAQITALMNQISALSGGTPGNTGPQAAGACTFTGSLTLGARGANVTCLQQYLEVGNYLVMPTGVAYGYFGNLTKAAVASWQAANGVSPAVGVFGPISIAKYNALAAAVTPPPNIPPMTGPCTGGQMFNSVTGASCSAALPAGCTTTVGFSPTTGMSCAGSPVVTYPAGCTSAVGFSPTTGLSCAVVTPPPSMGGAGSIEDVDFISGLNNEQVGEDESDVKVAGLTIKADTGSDLELSAVNLDFDYADSGASTKFDHYADSVSLWFGGKEVARLDSSEFTNDNNYSKTVSLSGGSIIRAGQTADLVVAISGISNLDTTDAGENWNVQFKSVRFRDGQGSSITDSSTGDIDNTSDESTASASYEREFSFATFATAANTEFKISESADAVNDGHTIVVDATQDTEDEPILAYDVEIKGTQDVSVDDLPVGVVVTGNDNVDDVLSGLSLWLNGESVGTANISDCLEDSGCSGLGTYETFLFDNMNLTLKAGTKNKFIVKADLYPITGTGDLAAGDTIAASTTASLVEISGYSDIEDASGETLVAADTNGTASSDASSFYASGIFPKFVSSATNVKVGSIAGDPDSVDLTIVFDITAVGSDDVWVERDFATQGAVASAAVDGQFWATTTDSTTGTSTSGFTAPSAPTLSANGSSSNDDTAGNDQDFKINSGDTRRFTFMVNIPAGGDNVNAGAMITGIKWGTTDNDDTMDNVYTTNLSDFKTTTVTGMFIH